MCKVLYIYHLIVIKNKTLLWYRIIVITLFFSELFESKLQIWKLYTSKYYMGSFPPNSTFLIATNQSSKWKKSLLIHFYPSFSNSPNNANYPLPPAPPRPFWFRIQPSISLYFIVMSFWSPSVWSSSSVFPCLAWTRKIYRVLTFPFWRLTFNLGLSDVFSWPDSRCTFLAGIPQRGCCALGVSYQQATDSNSSH